MKHLRAGAAKLISCAVQSACRVSVSVSHRQRDVDDPSDICWLFWTKAQNSERFGKFPGGVGTVSC